MRGEEEEGKRREGVGKEEVRGVLLYSINCTLTHNRC